ncbi:hypothetical protein CIPAW_10G131800 [Carya illinoinensis]|uniref:Uncharacterized protein n=1 Tax=Carya illinoinensis TaxID=32201 RepID=A0A8T1P5I9_CARIL|nr:hypothetical protein CIPAW_10G131800 [Carya illinoinensis]
MISKNTPRSLSVNASKRTCCIFKVPHTFVGNSYHPSAVSIGPYHRGKPQLMMIEEHKWRYLNIKLLEKEAREYHSEIIQLESPEFIEMMIPFFILEKLFEISKIPNEEESNLSLSLLAMQFFNEAIALQRPHDFICRRSHDLKGSHLLDLVRLSFILEELKRPQSSGTPTHVMHSFSRLHRSGIKLNLVQEESFLVVKFKNGVIEMPRIRLDKFMGSFLSNCLAFEQCHCDVSKHFTTYATFLECLVESAKDVGYLCHHNIMDNNLGNDDEIARFINKMGKDMMINSNCYLFKNCWNVQWATFKRKYFDTPWAFISALVTFVLLLLAIAQTFYTIYAYL